MWFSNFFRFDFCYFSEQFRYLWKFLMSSTLRDHFLIKFVLFGAHLGHFLKLATIWIKYIDSICWWYVDIYVETNRHAFFALLKHKINSDYNSNSLTINILKHFYWGCNCYQWHVRNVWVPKPPLKGFQIDATLMALSANQNRACKWACKWACKLKITEKSYRSEPNRTVTYWYPSWIGCRSKRWDSHKPGFHYWYFLTLRTFENQPT